MLRTECRQCESPMNGRQFRSAIFVADPENLDDAVVVYDGRDSLVGRLVKSLEQPSLSTLVRVIH